MKVALGHVSMHRRWNETGLMGVYLLINLLPLSKKGRRNRDREAYLRGVTPVATLGCYAL